MNAMDEKIPPGSLSHMRQARQPRWRILAWIVAPLLLWYTLTTHVHFRIRPNHCHDTTRVSYEGESVSWERCGEITGHPLECTNVTVPMNHFTPDNGSHVDANDKVFIIPLIRLRAKNATQNLIINPGGPGGSGIGMVYAQGDEINTILNEGYHILSFDPRGVNRSIPKAECYPDEETRRAHSRPHRGGTLSDTGDMYAWNKNLARACYDTMGEHAKYSG